MTMIENLPKESLPRITILIATHNYGHYIKDAIKSAIEQDYQNKNVVVVDDCSTDNTETIVREFFDKNVQEKDYGDFHVSLAKVGDVSLMYIKINVNVGPSEARNIGIEFTKNRTDIYAVLDADDIMHRQKLSRCVSLFLMSPAVGVVYADYDNYNVHTGVVTREYKEPFSYQRLMQECIVHSGSLISINALEAVKDDNGYYDKYMRTAEDYDLWIRIAEKYAIMHVPEPLTIVRVHNDNSTYTVDKQVWEKNWQRINQKCANRIKTQ